MSLRHEKWMVLEGKNGGLNTCFLNGDPEFGIPYVGLPGSC